MFLRIALFSLVVGLFIYYKTKPKSFWISTGFYEWRCVKTYKSGISRWSIQAEEHDLNDPDLKTRWREVNIHGCVKYQKDCPSTERLNDPWLFTRPLPPRLTDDDS